MPSCFFLLAPGGEQRIEIVVRATIWFGQKVADRLAAPEHLVDVVRRGEQRMHQRIVGEGLAVDVDRTGQRVDQTLAIAQRMLHGQRQLPLETRCRFKQRVDQLGDPIQRLPYLGRRRRRGLQKIGNGRNQAQGVAFAQIARPALAPFGRLMALEIQLPMAASLARSMPVSIPNPCIR